MGTEEGHLVQEELAELRMSLDSEVMASSHRLVLPRFVLSELVETEKMYVDDLGQIVEVVLSSSRPRSTHPFPLPGDISTSFLVPLLLDPVLGLPRAEVTSSQSPLILPPHRVTWLPWLLRGSLRVFEVVTGLCSGTFSKSMSGTESE